jgi:PHD/YefM family antitoxin component YafN of YafNO toxin-antitoxin module
MNWVYTRAQLQGMSDEELNELAIVTPLRDDCYSKLMDKNTLLQRLKTSKLEKERRYRMYKNAMVEFKRASINPDGSKALMTMDLCDLRETKEFRYRLYKEEMVEFKRLTIQKKNKNEAYILAHKTYIQSMEHFVLRLIYNRAIHAQIQRQQFDVQEINQGFRLQLQQVEDYLSSSRHEALIRLPLKESINFLNQEEIHKPMDDICIICMDKHNICDTLLTSCGHCFGKECFAAWHKQRVSLSHYVNCPMCKNEENLYVTRFVERIEI